MRGRTQNYKAAWLAGGVLAFVTILHFLSMGFPRFDLVRRLELMTYDWRVRQAVRYVQPRDAATNLGAVFIDDESLQLINQAWTYPWPWPRQLHGRLVSQLSRDGAESIAFDILFKERQPDLAATRVPLRNGQSMGSDEYFAQQIRQSGRVVLAAFGEATIDGGWQAIVPNEFFRTNAWKVAHATSVKDADGVLRRVKAYRDDAEVGRIWHLGIVVGARHLGLDLDNALVEPGRITLRGPDGLERVIPVDSEGYFYINWVLSWNDPRLFKQSFQEAAGLLPKSPSHVGASAAETENWKGRLVFVGSIGSGNNISDVGTTPIAKETYLVSNHWNVTNSLITGRFVVPLSGFWEVLLIWIFGVCSAFLTWRLRVPWPSIAIVLMSAGYVGFSLFLFVQGRYWLPLVMPVLGGLTLTHISLVTYQVFFEQREKRHVKSVFAKLVSPEVVNELLDADQLHLGGARRRITVMFTDVRGFTEMTDAKQEEAICYAQNQRLSEKETEAYFNAQAQDTLATVNDYLAVIADEVKKHKGTLDKYIGDCVMAFWGAPTTNEHHAASCVQAAIDAQKAIHFRNLEKSEENRRRQLQNHSRAALGQPPIPLLPMLALGTGVNTGSAIVGLMGSTDHIFNYTVFGRDVNLASRLETVAGRGRIIISEETYRELLKTNPELAARCQELPSVNVKGIRNAVQVFEVAWQDCEVTELAAA